MKPHYLARNPGWGLPLVALLLNAAAIAYFHQPVQEKANLVIGVGEVPQAKEPRLLVLAPELYEVNGQTYSSANDLEFKLTALATEGSAIRILTRADVPAEELTRVLQMCNGAGFTQLALQAQPAVARTDGGSTQ